MPKLRGASAAYAWLAVPLVIFASWFNVQEMVLDEPVGLTAWFVVSLPLTAVGAVAVWSADASRLWRTSWPIVIAFGVLLGWGAVRVIGFATCVSGGTRETTECYPEWVAWLPLAQAAITMGLAWLMVAAVRSGHLRLWLAWVSAAVVVMTMIGFGRAVLHPRGFNRLGTGLGGAAVLSLALVLAIVVLASASRRYWRNWTGKLFGGLAVVGVIETVLTFSRAGMALLLLAAVVLALRVLPRPSRRVGLGLGAGVLTAGIALLLIFPQLALRLLTLGDPGRAGNTATALENWSTSWEWVLFGTGTASRWPWYGVDAHLIWAPQDGLLTVEGVSGHLLISPHSLFLGALVEWGIIGLVLVLAMCGGVAWVAWRAARTPVAGPAMVMAALSLGAFALDTYLLRNPGVSFIWWLVVFAGARSLSAPR